MNHQAIQKTQIAIVGAGIVGLAQARAYARRGYEVTVFERSPAAVGASIRNFGMVWPIGQPAGPRLEMALQSRAIWKEVAAEAGFFCSQEGSLHLAYHEDEWQVLQEFWEAKHSKGYEMELLTPQATLQKKSRCQKQRTQRGFAEPYRDDCGPSGSPGKNSFLFRGEIRRALSVWAGGYTY
ncbi:MAG: FAD-dependent oxidoreductase [Microscillaceae bacterium]|nr:FAD-dependent oxidoreductase [Microscillaceae bacterium]